MAVNVLVVQRISFRNFLSISLVWYYVYQNTQRLFVKKHISFPLHQTQKISHYLGPFWLNSVVLMTKIPNNPSKLERIESLAHIDPT